MSTTALKVHVVMYDDNHYRMHVVFEDVIARRNFEVHNTPVTQQFDLIRDYCEPVVNSIFIRWIKEPIRGIASIYCQRHHLTIHRANLVIFPWEKILFQLSQAILEAYPGHHIEWSHEGTKEGIDQIIASVEQEVEKGRQVEQVLEWANGPANVDLLPI